MTFINRKCVLPKYQRQGPDQLSEQLLPPASQCIPHVPQNPTTVRDSGTTGRESTPSALPQLRPALPGWGMVCPWDSPRLQAPGATDPTTLSSGIMHSTTELGRNQWENTENEHVHVYPNKHIPSKTCQASPGQYLEPRKTWIRMWTCCIFIRI